MSNMDESRIPAIISGKRSVADNCVCNMCHGIGYVAKIKYPTTLYYKTGNGNERELSQRYHNLWLCDECRLKLMDVLEVCGEAGS